jgi:tetratricopeptide (TPR) repeat protein
VQVYIYKNGQQYGPYDEATVTEWARTGECSLTDLAIREGMKEWHPLWAVIPDSDGMSGDLEAEFELFESYGVILDSMTGMRSDDPRIREQALSQYQQLLEILRKQLAGLKARFSGEPEVLMIESFFYMKSAGLELYRNNVTASLDLFDKSIGVLDTPSARLVKASIYESLNRRQEAIRELDWVIANFPDQPEYSPALNMRQQI